MRKTILAAVLAGVLLGAPSMEGAVLDSWVPSMDVMVGGRDEDDDSPSSTPAEALAATMKDMDSSLVAFARLPESDREAERRSLARTARQAFRDLKRLHRARREVWKDLGGGDREDLRAAYDAMLADLCTLLSASVDHPRTSRRLLRCVAGTVRERARMRENR